MSIKQFLSESKYAYIIAKVAIVFQTILTVSIATLLFITIATSLYPKTFLSFLLTLDMVFVCTHLLYRRLYAGTKVTFTITQKKILFCHIISSLLALGITSYIVFTGIDIVYEWMCLAIASWIISLTSGIVFFYKKYNTFF